MLRTMMAVGAVIALGGGVCQAQDAAGFVDQVQVISPQISPGGGEVALIRRTAVEQQVVVINLAAKQARAIQTIKETGRFGYDWVRWKGDGRLVIGATVELVAEGRAATGQVLKQKDQTYRVSRVFALGTDGRNAVQMFQGQLSQLVGNLGSTALLDELPAEPGHVLISAIDNSGVGAWKADVATGKVQQVANGGWQTADYTTDGTGYPVMRIDATENVQKIFRRAAGSEAWIPAGERRQALLADMPDYAIVGPGPKANQVYIRARNDGDRMGLYLYNTASGEFGEPLTAGAEADAGWPWINPVTRELVATCEFSARLACKAADPGLQKYVKALDQFFEGKATVQLINMSNDQSKWLLRVDMPTEGRAFYVFDVKTVNMEKIGDSYPGIPAGTLSPVEVVPYTARDGAKLFAYVTAKSGGGAKPMVVLPHGGPESRDYYEFDAFAQFLAAHGYVVVQPNFRGSRGFGEAFALAGRGQWGLRMQDDVTDAVKHMIDTGKADPKRVCIVGASYGGYAALAGVTLTPDLYKCAVSIAGVSDLPYMLGAERSESGASSNVFYYWRDSIGDPVKDRVALEAASPRRQATKVNVPVLLIHGEKDEAVPVRQSQIMQDALKAAGKQSRLIRLKEADHYWDNWERKDLMTLYQETAAFLKEHLK
jgi:dipeptidyl aminopeptidase/acylaminoacyl peptidase